MALHLADGRPFVFENRWINLTTAPNATAQSFDSLSTNEWLLSTMPYTHGDIRFTAEAANEADETEAELVPTTPGAPLYLVERATWDHNTSVTLVQLCYGPGYCITTTIGIHP